ncbi:MAG: sigma-70 family RNA polymerase sigma factor [Acidobacteriota bacterium]|nr:sigma-70 family RNA polymerase sigma factor [Acidobacteriota bacterium]
MPTPIDLHISADALADAAAIERVLDGETQAFAQLVSRYQAVLYRYAVSIVLNHDVAADMVQDAFVRAYTSLASCRDRTRFRAWLFQTLRHRCLDYLKEPRRRDVSLDETSPVSDVADGPRTLVERQELRTEIEQALARLPEAQREAFILHYVEEVPYDTMAELLGASVSALKMRVLRARETLGSALQSRNVTKLSAARLSSRRR